jgi:hypothetical protein
VKGQGPLIGSGNSKAGHWKVAWFKSEWDFRQIFLLSVRRVATVVAGEQ